MGAYFDSMSGEVQFLGQHLALKEITKRLPPGDVVRTAGDLAVPAVEAFAMLYAGNQRFSSGHGGNNNLGGDLKLLEQLSEGGQNPVAIIVGCADSRAPIEILYDMRPGDLFVLRNAGNAFSENQGSLLGSAEYSISHLHTKLIIVTGHTKCGAVTAAVQAVKNHTDLKRSSGSIWRALNLIVEAAQRAVTEIPDASLDEQVKLATKYNVQNTIRKLIQSSDLIYTGAKLEELQVHGAIYNIFSGEMEWLGEHPNLEAICQREMPMYRWRISPHIPLQTWIPDTGGASSTVKEIIEMLLEGNERFLSGVCHFKAPRGVSAPPSVMVLTGMEFRVPIENVFDVEPGRLIVQRVLGSFPGNQWHTSFHSIEYSLLRWAPSVLVVMVETQSPIIDEALKQLRGQSLPLAPIRVVLDHVVVSALRAVLQMEKYPHGLTAAARELLILSLSTELNCLYSMELLLKSKVIRDKASPIPTSSPHCTSIPPPSTPHRIPATAPHPSPPHPLPMLPSPLHHLHRCDLGRPSCMRRSWIHRREKYDFWGTTRSSQRLSRPQSYTTRFTAHGSLATLFRSMQRMCFSPASRQPIASRGRNTASACA